MRENGCHARAAAWAGEYRWFEVRVWVWVLVRCSHGHGQKGQVVQTFGLYAAPRSHKWVLGPEDSSTETTVRRPKVCCRRVMVGRPKLKMVLLSLGLPVLARSHEMSQGVGRFGRRRRAV